MRVIGVIDLREGRAVHARGGDRASYGPVDAAAGTRVDGDPNTLGRAYVDVLGVRELYVADLDAIERGSGAMQRATIRALAAIGVPLWVDAGVSSQAYAAEVLGAGATTVIVGLETLTSFEALAELCAAVGGQRVAFSVDLRDGVPIAMPNVANQASTASGIAARAAEAGVGSVIVLDVARVGTSAGVDIGVLADVRGAAPSVTLVAGGGVRDSSDLRALATVGCDGALVATALLTGAIRATEATGEVR